ncbi:MAG: FecR domain-containing protein [Myxococcales bacterium]
MTNHATEPTREALAAAFPERPIAAPDGGWLAEKKRVVTEIQAALARPRSRRRRSASGFHWGEALAVVGLSLGLAFVVGRIIPGPLRDLPAQAFQAIDSKGRVLCDRNDGKHWTTCDPLSDKAFVGLRTLEQGMVTVKSVAGVRLRLEAFSTLLMADPSNAAAASRVTLSEGSMDVMVPTLAPNHRFSVVTPNATLTVLGTAFTVEVKKGSNQPSQTCVRLREGSISIHTVGRDLDLVAPATWGCSVISNRGEVIAARDRPSAEPSKAAARSDGRRSATKRSPPAAQIRAAQLQPNRLLRRGLAAEQRKDWVAAERLLRNLLTLYPDSGAAVQGRLALERVHSQKPEPAKGEALGAELPKPETSKAEAVGAEIPKAESAESPKDAAAAPKLEPEQADSKTELHANDALKEKPAAP